MYDSDDYSDDGFVNNRRYVKLRLDLDEISSIKKLRIKIKCSYNRILANESIEPQIEPNQSTTDLSLLELFQKQVPYDFHIEIGTQTFPTHRHILILRSDYFKTLFESQLNDSTTNHLTLTDDIHLQAFEILLKYLYTNRFDTILNNEFLLIELFKLSDRFLIDSLKQRCLHELLRNHLNKDNVFQYLNLFDTYNDCTDLREKCFTLFHKHPYLLKTSDFNQLERTNSKLALQIYGSFF